jgi:hypothetical protein
MIEIWARVIKEQKIVTDFIYKSSGENLEQMMRSICEKADIPAPLLLDKHKKQFKKFNQAKFIKEEFVESVDFDRLIIENVTAD